MSNVARNHALPVILTMLLAAPIAFAGAAGADAEAKLAAALRDEKVQAALRHVDANAPATAAWLAEIGGIVSPSGQEHRRAEAVAARMKAIGLQQVRVDSTPNAIGVLPGRSGRALVFVSTLDDLGTVAEHQRAAAHPPRVEGDRVVGPGTNTSSTTAAMLAAADALVKAGVRTQHDLVFASVAQEETGLTGMRSLYAEYRDRAIGFVDVLGDGRSISYGAIGIHWWRIVADGPPGHSLGGGLPNVNQAIGRAVDRILQLPHPERHKDQRTVVNVAMLSSGAVFNHKPASGWFSLDIRSLDDEVISEIEREVKRILSGVTGETTIQFTMEPFQLTPGGQIEGARDSLLVRSAEAISQHLGLEPRLGNSGSSNMNVAIGGGTPAIGLGGGRGDRRGFPDEWADVPAMMRSAKHLVLLAVTVGGGAGQL
jgi:acetylornithine deacetylase/succinyl-diaminopimelate desuccinylase-like protein